MFSGLIDTLRIARVSKEAIGRQSANSAVGADVNPRVLTAKIKAAESEAPIGKPIPISSKRFAIRCFVEIRQINDPVIV